MRGDMFVWRTCQAEDEVLEVSEKEDEHKTQQGPYSFPCTGTYSLENHPGVSYPASMRTVSLVFPSIVTRVFVSLFEDYMSCQAFFAGVAVRYEIN
jgi:hypothetical protein